MHRVSRLGHLSGGSELLTWGNHQRVIKQREGFATEFPDIPPNHYRPESRVP